MTECGTCKKPILDEKGVIKCSGSCTQTFHLGCTPIQTEENITKLGVTAQKWECPKCSSDEGSPSSFVDEVVTRSALEDVIRELKASPSQKTDDVVKELADLRKSVGSLSKQVGELKKTVGQVEDDIGLLQLENTRLQTRNGNLWRTMVRLGDDVNDLQQRRCDREAGSQEGTDDAAKSKAALVLSYLTTAGLFYFIVSRMFKSAMKILEKNTDDQV